MNPSKVYYDIQIANYASTTTAPPNVIFNEVREGPLIADASLYEMSIVRFQLDTLSIPCFTAEIQLSQPNPNLCVYYNDVLQRSKFRPNLRSMDTTKL